MLDKIVERMPQELVVWLWIRIKKIRWLRTLLVRSVNVKFTAGLMGLIRAENGDILIVKHTYKDIPWGLPSGGLKKEQPFTGLAREVYEETGFNIEPLKVLDIAYADNSTNLLILIEAKLIGGLFTPSPEVCDYAFLRPPDGLDKLPVTQRTIIEKYF